MAASAGNLFAFSPPFGWRTFDLSRKNYRFSYETNAPCRGPGAASISGEGTGKDSGYYSQTVSGTSLVPGARYAFAVSYRTQTPMKGAVAVSVVSYDLSGGRTVSYAKNCEGSALWHRISDMVTVSTNASRLQIVLRLTGSGTVWFDDVSLRRDVPGAAELLENPDFSPSAAFTCESAPQAIGSARITADFENASLGSAVPIGPDTYYLRAMPNDRPRCPFFYFHFRIADASGRMVTLHIDPSPYSAQWLGGGTNTRMHAVVSKDRLVWTSPDAQIWSDDGSLLTLRVSMKAVSYHIASVYPGGEISRFASANASPYVSVTVLTNTAKKRPLTVYCISDPAVPRSAKRDIMFTALHHDLETSGALFLERICTHLLSDTAKAAALRRAFEFTVIPQIDVDGIAEGNLYLPSVDTSNCNRQWGKDTVPQITAIEQLVMKRTREGRRLALFVDFHGWWQAGREFLFMTYGKEIAGDRSEEEAGALIKRIRPALSGTINVRYYRNMESHLTMGSTDLRSTSAGWMKFIGNAAVSFTFEPFVDPSDSMGDFDAWGRGFIEAIADHYDIK